MILNLITYDDLNLQNRKISWKRLLCLRFLVCCLIDAGPLRLALFLNDLSPHLNR